MQRRTAILTGAAAFCLAGTAFAQSASQGREQELRALFEDSLEQDFVKRPRAMLLLERYIHASEQDARSLVGICEETLKNSQDGDRREMAAHYIATVAHAPHPGVAGDVFRVARDTLLASPQAQERARGIEAMTRITAFRTFSRADEVQTILQDLAHSDADKDNRLYALSKAAFLAYAGKKIDLYDDLTRIAQAENDSDTRQSMLEQINVYRDLSAAEMRLAPAP